MTNSISLLSIALKNCVLKYSLRPSTAAVGIKSSAASIIKRVAILPKNGCLSNNPTRAVIIRSITSTRISSNASSVIFSSGCQFLSLLAVLLALDICIEFNIAEFVVKCIIDCLLCCTNNIAVFN